MRISALVYPVTDLAIAKRFYGEVLGLKERHANDQAGWVAYLTDGGVALLLRRKPELAGKGGPSATFECPDLELLRARLVQAGARVDGEIEEGKSVRVLRFYDPDGNALEAAEAR